MFRDQMQQDPKEGHLVERSAPFSTLSVGDFVLVLEPICAK